MVKRSSAVLEPWRRSDTTTGYTSPQTPVSGLQPRTSGSLLPAAQAPGPVAGGLAFASGTTVTQADAVRPPGPATTGTSGSRSNVLAVGAPPIACWSWEASIMRP